MKIEKSVPLMSTNYGRTSGSFGLFSMMEPGDSILLPDSDPEKMNRDRSAFRVWCFKNNRKGASRKVDGGVRIWLLK